MALWVLSLFLQEKDRSNQNCITRTVVTATSPTAYMSTQAHLIERYEYESKHRQWRNNQTCSFSLLPASLIQVKVVQNPPTRFQRARTLLCTSESIIVDFPASRHDIIDSDSSNEDNTKSAHKVQFSPTCNLAFVDTHEKFDAWYPGRSRSHFEQHPGEVQVTFWTASDVSCQRYV